jgi:hypothetical protein
MKGRCQINAVSGNHTASEPNHEAQWARPLSGGVKDHYSAIRINEVVFVNVGVIVFLE